MRKALVRRGGQIIEVDVDDNHVNQLRKAKTGLQVSKSSSDPCPPDFYWDEDEGKCVPMSATLPKREELYTNPKMLKDLQRLNNKRRVTDYKKHYTKTRDDFWNENFKGPYIDENGQKVPDRNSPEFINYKKLSDDRFKDMPNPWFDKNFKLPEDFKKKDFYPKDGEWDEDSKKQFNEFFNTEPSQQEKEQIIWKEYHKNNSTSPSFDQRDIPQDDPSLQYKMNPDELRQYRYDEEWCPCYKTKDELIAGRMVTKKVCIPCEQAKMGGSLAKFMQDGGEGSKYPLNDMGEEIRYHKEFDRRGKRITKEKLVRPADPEIDGDRSSTRYVKRILEDSGQGRVVSRPSGIDYFLNPHHANFFGEPRDGSYIDYEINPNFNQQPRMFQMGGAPQEQMPLQQEGQAQGQGSEQDQIMQLIQAYAQAMGISPEEIIQELQQMNPEEQKQAIDQMAQELQGGQQAQAPEQQMSPEQMMQMGGASNIYTPDTGRENFTQPVLPPGADDFSYDIPNDESGNDYIEYDMSDYPVDTRDPRRSQHRRRPTLQTSIRNIGRTFKHRGSGKGSGFNPKLCKWGDNSCYKQEGGPTNGELDIDRFKPESKLQTFLQLAQGYGQMNHDKAFEKDVYNDIKKFQIGGNTQNADGSSFYDYGSGYNPNKLKIANRFQGSADKFDAKGDKFGAFANVVQTVQNGVAKVADKAWKVAKVAAPIAANVVAPGSGMIVKAGMNAMEKKPAAGGTAPAAGSAPPTGGAAGGNPLGALSGMLGGGGGAGAAGGGAAGAAAGGLDLSALASFVKYGGSLPRYQINGQFDPKSLMPDFSNPEIGTNMELPPVEPDNSVEAWRKQMQDNSAATEDGKNWDPLEFSKKDMKKYNLDPAENNVTQKPGGITGKDFMQATKGMGPAISGFIGAMGNAGKAKKAQIQADAKLNSDSLFDANYGSRGDYVTNTQPGTANFRPDQNIPMGPNASEFGKYGMQLAKSGTQVQNPYMSNPNSHPEAVLYGEPDQKISNTLKPVKREHANLEAEVGEVAVTPAGPDGVPKFFKIGGKNHYDGGTPLSLPENTFIFSKTRSMIIKDPKILKELTGSTKPSTPADLAKKFDYSQYVAVIQNENSDPVERKTAQMMIESMMYKLGQIAIIQEAKKGFPSGIPLIAGPYLEKAGIDPQMLLPQTEEPEQEDPGMQQQMDPAMQEQMMQQPQQQMDPRMMQEQMGQPAMQVGGQRYDYPETREQAQNRFYNEMEGKVSSNDGDERQGFNRDMYGIDYYIRKFQEAGLWDNDESMEKLTKFIPKPVNLERQYNRIPEANNANNYPAYMGDNVPIGDPRYKVNLLPRKPSEEEYAYGGSTMMNRLVMQKGGNKNKPQPKPWNAPIPTGNNIEMGSGNLVTAGYGDRDTTFSEEGMRNIHTYDNGLPNDTSYSYISNRMGNNPATEDYFYNTGQNTQDGKPISNYNSGSTAPLDRKVYLDRIKRLAGYAYGGTTWVPPDEELLSMGYSPSHIEAIKLADKKSPVFDSEAAYNNIAYNAAKAKAYGTEKDAARYATYAKDRLDQALRDGIPLQSLQFSENRPVLSNDKRRNRLEDYDKNRLRNEFGEPTESINDYESRMKREATFRYGGSNIMGSPVLPRYQSNVNTGQFTSGPGRTGNFNYARQLFGPYNIDEKLIQPQEEEQPNFAQRALGPLFDYLSKEKEEENIPINTTKVYEATSPVKGFKDNDERDNFITSGKELGVDLNPVYNAYTGAILGIAELKKGLINGSIPFDIYEKEREGLVQRIDSIKTELSETNQAIDNTDSWSWNPWSTANKLQDLENILSEEKSALNVKANSLKKFREIQNDYSTLINEKKLLEEQLNDPNIDDLDLSALRRKMKDLDKALYIENIKVKDFGKRLIKNNASDVPVDEDWITNSLGEALRMDNQNTKGEQPNPYDGSWRWVGKFFTYKEYLKKHGLIGQPSVSTSTDTPTDGSTNVTPNSQMVADSIAKTTPYVEVPVEAPSQPVQSQPAKTQSGKPAVSRPTTNKSKTKKIITFGPNDLNNIKIIQQP